MKDPVILVTGAIGMTFSLVAHWIAKHVIKLVANQYLYFWVSYNTGRRHVASLAVNGLSTMAAIVIVKTIQTTLVQNMHVFMLCSIQIMPMLF